MIEVAWDATQRNIMLWKFSENWDFDQFHQAHKAVDAMIDQVDGYVDSLFLTSHGQNIPRAGLTNLRRIASHQHPRHRYTVIVGSGAFLSSLLRLIGEMVPNFRSRLFFAHTPDEAYDLLEQKRGPVKA